MEDIWQHCREQMRWSQARYEKYSTGSQPPSYKVGDQVWLNVKNIVTKRPAKKLDVKNMGPYTIQEVVNSRAYRLALPEQVKVHDVFHVSQLQPYKPPSIPGHAEAQAPPPPVVVDPNDQGGGDTEPQYEVKEVVTSICAKAKGAGKHSDDAIWYQVRWIGYDQDDPTWEVWDNVLPHAHDLVVGFHNQPQNKGCPRPAASQYDWNDKKVLQPSGMKDYKPVLRKPSKLEVKANVDRDLPTRRSIRLQPG